MGRHKSYDRDVLIEKAMELGSEDATIWERLGKQAGEHIVNFLPGVSLRGSMASGDGGKIGIA